MNVIEKPIRDRVAVVMTAPFVAGTGLGVTISRPAEYKDQASIVPGEFEFWDTLDAPNANPWNRLHRIRRTNEEIRLLSAGDIYFGGGTGSGEPPQYAVAEAQSNRIQRALRSGGKTLRSGVDRVREQIRPVTSSPSEPVTDVAAAVADIRSMLSLSITDLSSILDVKRPTIYSWLRGDAQPHAKNLERISSLHQISQSWSRLSGRPMRRHLRHAFDGQGVTLLELLKVDDLDFVEIEQHLSALSQLPASPKPAAMKDIAVAHGLPTKSNPDAELIRDIESGRRLTND